MAESSSSGSFGIVKLNNTNYQAWKYKVEKLLKREGTWRALSTPKPIGNEEAIESWEVKDEKAQGTICLLLEDDQTPHTLEKKTAKEIWDALEKYHQKASGINKFSLVVELLQLKLSEGEDLEKHISKIQELTNNLTALGSKGINEFAPWIILHSMPPSYHTLVSILASKPEEELTIDNIKATLIGEYKRRKMSTEHTDESALKVHNNKPHANFECFFCGSTEHYKQNCEKYLQWKQKKNQKQRRSERARAVQEEYTMSESDSDESIQQQAYSVNTIKSKQRIRKEWFLDSAASSHMTNDITFFENIDATYTSTVRVANGNSCTVHGIGKGSIECLTNDGKCNKLMLDRVLYVPTFESGLISIGALDKQGYQVKIKNNQMSILKNDVVIAVGDGISHMYKLKTIEYAFAVMPQHTSNCIHVWHSRFAHRDPKAIKLLASKNLADGMKLDKCQIKQVCESCVKGKISRKPFPEKSKTASDRPLDLIHSDLCGPMSTATPGGRKYVMTLIDDYSKYTYSYLLTLKSQAELVIRQFIEYCETQFGRKPKIFRSDRGGEYIGQSLKEYLKNNGIEVQQTIPYTPEQNGLAERKNRYLMEAVRTMLIDARLSNTYWGEAVMTATYLQNRLPTRTRTKTPYELWFNKRPDISNLKAFGCRAYAHIPKELRKKLHPKARECVLVGYPQGSKGYRLLEKSSRKIFESRDVTFLEECRTQGEGIDDACEFQPLVEQTEESPDTKQNTVFIPLETTEEEKPKAKHESFLSTGSGEAPSSLGEELVTGEASGNTNSANNTPEQAQAARNVDTEYEFIYDKENDNDEAEPKTYEEAISGPHSQEWIKAIQQELKSLHEHNTWDLEPVPRNKKTISCKWIFKIKTMADGKSKRFKARLVAQGFSQKYGTDYDEVFAPVVMITTVRTFLCVAGERNYFVRQVDIKTAYLNGKLREIIYMVQPPGCVDEKHPDWGCRLNQGLYGLRQAAREWNNALDEYLIECNFVRSEEDPCLYKHGTRTLTWLLVHVDDILIMGKSLERINEIIQALNDGFELTDLGEVQCYLGINIKRNELGDFSMNQSNYIEKVIRRTKLDQAKPSTYPMDVGYEKLRLDSPEIKNEYYSKLIGALLYIAVNTRPDILAPVILLAQHNKDTRKVDWNEAQRVCRYLKGTIDYELKLSEQDNARREFEVYSDANYAEDRENRKSNSGYVVRLFGGTIGWACKKQECVSTSVTESEIIALSVAAKECIGMKNLLNFLDEKVKEPMTIHEDNQGCIKNVTTIGRSTLTKHIDTKYLYTKELIKKGIVQVTYCQSPENLADILTKPLGPQKTKALAGMMGLGVPRGHASDQ